MLDAALLLFSEKGYHNVSMQEIAEKAEFAVGTFYKHFKNKADLYQTLILVKSNEFDAAFEKAINASTDEVEKLRYYIRTKSALFKDNLSFIRLFIAENTLMNFDTKCDMNTVIKNRHHNLLKNLSDIFESGIKSKRFKPVAPPFNLAIALDGVVNAFLMLWVNSPEKHPFPKQPDTILDLFFKGLMDA